MSLSVCIDHAHQFQETLSLGKVTQLSPVLQTTYPRRPDTTNARLTGSKPGLHSGAKFLYTSGRPPWYDSTGQLKDAFVIGMPMYRLLCMYSAVSTVGTHAKYSLLFISSAVGKCQRQIKKLQIHNKSNCFTIIIIFSNITAKV